MFVRSLIFVAILDAILRIYKTVSGIKTLMTSSLSESNMKTINKNHHRLPCKCKKLILFFLVSVLDAILNISKCDILNISKCDILNISKCSMMFTEYVTC